MRLVIKTMSYFLQTCDPGFHFRNSAVSKFLSPSTFPISVGGISVIRLHFIATLEKEGLGFLAAPEVTSRAGKAVKKALKMESSFILTSGDLDHVDSLAPRAVGITGTRR